MRVLLVVPALLIAACSTPPVQSQPTANVASTVETQVRATLTAVVPTVTARPVPTVTPTGPAIGSQVWLYAKTSSGDVAKIVEVVNSPEDLQAYLKVQQANDVMGLVELEGANRAFGVETGRKVLVLDTRPELKLLRVRVIDGPKQPLAGWVPYEWTVTALPSDFAPTPTPIGR